jgi:signal transduction histidine kinase
MHTSVAAVDASLKQLVLHSSRIGGPEAAANVWDPALTSAVAGMTSVGSISVTNANGTIRHSTISSLVGASRKDDFLFNQLANNPNAGIVADKPFQSRIDQRIIIPIGRRLTAADGSFQGIVVATLIPAAFRNFYQSVDIGTDGIVWVTHSTGQLFFREQSLESANADKTTSLPISLLQSNSRGVIDVPLKSGGPNYITAWRALDEPPIIVAVSLNKSEALRIWRRDAWWSLGLTIIVALVITSASLLLLRQLGLREAVESSLLKRDQELIAAQRIAGFGVARFDSQNFRAEVAPQFSRMLGLPAATTEITIEQVLQRLIESDQPVFRQAFESCVESGKPWQLEVQLKLDDGTERIMWTEGGKHADEDAKDSDVLAIFHDVTEHRLAEQRSNQSERLAAIGRLTGGVAHDFNNILTVIIGRSGLLLAQLAPDSPDKTSIEEIDRAAQRAAGLTRQLLAFSRKQILQAKVMDLNTVVTDIESMIRRLIGEDIQLVLNLEPSLGQIKGDQGQLEQVLMNLAVNSRDAMPLGGMLIIETNNVSLDENYARNHITVEAGNFVLLAVSDTGMGMEKDVQEHIFEPFFSTKPAGKGTGLGLSTVYGIIKQSGGNIWVYSEPGKGTTFKIYLPRIGEAPQAKSSEERVAPPVRGSETILLVEDEDSLRHLARDVLEMNGYRVIDAPNGSSALELYNQQDDRVHLLLTDVVMPGMSGRELAERATQLDPELKVIYMSGYTDDTVVLHAVFDEGIDFIQKPFSPDSLAEKVRVVLDKEA